MRKTRNTASFAALLGAGMFIMSMPSLAQKVTIIGEPVTLHVYEASAAQAADTAEDTPETSAVDMTETEVLVGEFSIIAQASNDMMLIHIGDDASDVYISKEELGTQLPELDLSGFPNVEEVAAIAQGAKGEEVEALQAALISLGYLDGTADGAYGSGTAEAVRKFQEANGLEATGSADIYTMTFLKAIENGVEESIEISSEEEYASPEEKFAKIIGKTAADLSAFMEPKWRFTYDEIDEIGAIDPSIDLGYFEIASPAIDEISGQLAVKVVIAKDEESKVIVAVPAITVETDGAYRPYVKGAVLAGDDTVRLDGGKSSGRIEGTTLLESGYVPLTKEAVELLKGGSVTKFRLLGRNTEYDVDVEYDEDAMAAFMDACETIAED